MHWWMLVMVWMPTVAFGQVNVEALRSNGTEDGISGSVGLSAAYTGGNIQFADFGATAKAEWKRNNDLLFIAATYRFAAKRTQADLLADPSIGLWDKEAHFSNNRLAHIRYNRLLSEGVWWEAYTQYEYNEFLLLDRRLLIGTGPRIRVFDGDSAGFAIGTSAMMEEERLNPERIHPNEDVNRINARSSTYASLTVRIAETGSWTSTVYVQPRFDALDDHRIVAESGLTMNLTRAVAWTVDGRFRTDSVPPETPEEAAPVVSSDFSIKNGLKFTF